MCLKKKNTPVRLHKKQESKYLELLKLISKNPNTWIIIIGIILLIFAISFAYKESIAFFVYNTGL